MSEEIKKILENIKCPQLGYDEYGKWGALPLNVRMTLKRLCDYVVSCDDYITNLLEENERLKIQVSAREELYEYSQAKINKAIEYIKEAIENNDYFEDDIATDISEPSYDKYINSDSLLKILGDEE